MAELLTNLGASVLASPLTSGATSLTLSNAANFPAGGNFRIKIDSELIIVGARSGTTFSSLTRGAEGTAAASHSSGAEVRHVITVAGLRQHLIEYIDAQRRAVASGYASLDGTGRIPSNQLPAQVVEYKGTWNANTNSPTLADGIGNTGDQFIVGTAGTRDLGSGSISWGVGDLVIYSGSVWQQVIGGGGGASGVASVLGLTGAITRAGLLGALTLVAADITDLAGILAAKADDTDLAAKADATLLDTIGPRRSLDAAGYGTPYLIGTDANGAQDIGSCFDTVTGGKVIQIPTHTQRDYTTKSWFAVAHTANSGTCTVQGVTSGGFTSTIRTALSPGSNVASVKVPVSGMAQFVRQNGGGTSDIWQALGDHTL